MQTTGDKWTLISDPAEFSQLRKSIFFVDISSDSSTQEQTREATKGGKRNEFWIFCFLKRINLN